MKNEQTVEVLNDLLTKAYDAEQGYEHAAQKSDDSPRLRSFFQSQSELRRDIGQGLKTTILMYGGEPDKGASVAAKAHQIWITLKDLATGSDDEAVLEECERGEEAALKDYDEALQNADLPADVVDMLRRQRFMIADALQTIKAEEAVADAFDD